MTEESVLADDRRRRQIGFDEGASRRRVSLTVGRLAENSERVTQIVGHVLGGSVAVRGSARQRLEADPFEFLRNRRRRCCRGGFPRRLAEGDPRQQLVLAVPDWVKQAQLLRQQFVEDDAEAKDVGPAVDPVSFALGLLRAHVGGGAGEAASLAEIDVLQSETEVGQDRRAGRVDQDVRGLHVAVDQSVTVGMVQRFRDDRHEAGRVRYVRRRGSQQPGQIGSLDELRHHETRAVLGAADVVDRNDVRMAGGAGLSASLGEIGFHDMGRTAGHPLGERHLDRHRSVEVVVMGQVDAAEAPLAEHLDDAVAADLRRHALRRVSYAAGASLGSMVGWSSTGS